MRVLVTGGAGYVGCVLVQELLARDCEVRVLDSLRKPGAPLVPLLANPRLEFQRGDVRDRRAVEEALRGADVVVHLAAVVGYPACERDPWLAREVNVGGTLNLTAARSPGQLIVFPSSLSNYGSVKDGLCTEEMEPQPLTLYGATKLEAERLVLEQGNAVVLRPATAFGLSPQLRLDLLFNNFMFLALNEGAIVVYQPHFWRAFIHVRDFARAILFAIDNAERMRDQVYNLGAEALNLTKGELAARIAERLGCRLQISEDGQDPDKRNYRVDFSKLEALGFRTQETINDGIEEMARGLQVISLPNPYSNASYY